MKSNEITIKMGNYYVIQRTKDGMFNATDLLRQFNEENKEKHIYDFIRTKSTKEYIHVLEFVESTYCGDEEAEIIEIERGRYGRIWMHPLLFLEFAAWLNPMFKYDIMSFVNEQLVNDRPIFRERANTSEILNTMPDYKTYILKDIKTWLIKIVRSSDISKTLLSLSMIGKESVVLMSIHDDVELELNLKYADRRRHDGWFDLSGDDLVNIYREYGR